MARHGTTRGGRFKDGQDLQFVYPALTTGSMPAGRLARLPGNPGTPPAPHRDSNPHPSSRPALRPPAHRTRDGVVGGEQARDGMAKAKSCADQVIADWYDDGRVGKIYPLHCYTRGDREAPAGRPRLLEREGRDRPRARVREAGQARPGRQRPLAGLDGDDRDLDDLHAEHDHDTTTTDDDTPDDDDDGRHRHDLDGRASDGHLRAVLGAGAAPRARWPRGAAPRSRLGRLPAPPDERRRRRRRHAAGRAARRVTTAAR